MRSYVCVHVICVCEHVIEGRKHMESLLNHITLCLSFLKNKLLWLTNFLLFVLDALCISSLKIIIIWNFKRKWQTRQYRYDFGHILCLNLIQHDIHLHKELQEYRTRRACRVYIFYISQYFWSKNKKLRLKLYIFLKILGLIFDGSVSNTHKSNY